MKKKNQLLAILAVGLLVGPIAAKAQYDYLFIDHAGGPDTQVFGINNRGNVVGNGIADPDTFPFVYASKKGGFTDVAPLAGYSSTSVLGTNNRGDMVGSVVSLDGLTTSGFIRDNNGNFTVFDHPDAVSFTQARGVNNKGLVTGFRDSPDDQFSPENGFIYDSKKDTFTDIVPSLFTLAHGITSRGDVVGSAVFFKADDPCPPSTDETTVRYGWLRTVNGAVTYFDVNGSRTSARGITDSGTIAGFVSDIGTIGIVAAKGFVVDLDGSQCQSITIDDGDLLAPPGAELTLLQGIRKTGEVVGWYDDGTNKHGFVATPQVVPSPPCPCEADTLSAVSQWESETGRMPADYDQCATDEFPSNYDSVLATRDAVSGDTYIEILARDFDYPRFTCVSRLIVSGTPIINRELEVPTEEEHSACRAIQESICSAP